MSDGLEITHGGAIAVDPDALRAVAVGMFALAQRFADAAASVREANRWLWGVPEASSRVDLGALAGVADRADALQLECSTAAENTRLMADVYELVERRQQLAALQIQDGAATASAVALHARIEQLLASDARVADMETWLIAEWEQQRFAGLDEPSLVIPTVGGLQPIFRKVSELSARGFGVLRPGATLKGSGGPVTVTALKTTTTARPAPPAGIADALRRVDGISEGQMRIERYEMPDGTNRFVLYEKGTQFFGGKDEPFDFESNIDLYNGQESASYAATVEALAQAGAEAGDRVDVVAHSQAAMNAAYLATGSDFDVQVQVTAGSPVHPSLAEDQLLVELRHTDDLVSSLAGGGLPGGSGSSESVVISRVADPFYGISKLGFNPHLLDTYIETAEMADASGDVRLQALEVDWAQLREAKRVTITDYQATRE